MANIDLKTDAGDFKEEAPKNATRVMPGKVQIYISMILQSSFYVLFVIPMILLALFSGLLPIEPKAAVTLSILMSLSALVYSIIMIWSMVYTWMFYKTIRYYYTDEAVICKTGVVWRKTITVPYPKITNVDVSQGPLQRWRKVGNVEIQTASGRPGQGGSMAEITFKGIIDPNKVRDEMMKWVQAHSSSKIVKPTQASSDNEIKAGETSGSINEQVLEELRAIRKILEKNSNSVS